MSVVVIYVCLLFIFSGLYYAPVSLRTPTGVNISGPPQTQQGLQTAAPHGPMQTPNIPVSGAIMPIVTPSAPSGMFVPCSFTSFSSRVLGLSYFIILFDVFFRWKCSSPCATKA